MKSLRLVKAKTRRAYNLAAQKYHDLFHNEMAEKEYDRKLLDAFAAKLPKGAAICDAGCGPSAHIIHTPKSFIDEIFDEFYRVLKPGGYLLVAVKAGTGEGYRKELLGIETEIYMALFSEEEIIGYFERAGFRLEFIKKRNPYDFEIRNERIFAIGRKA